MSASLNINFAEFGVSYWNGFLPDETPLAKLSDIYYWEWEAIVERLPLFLRNKYLRRSVDRIQVLSTSHLVSEPEWRRAYLVLAFMTHAYIWEAGGPSQVSQKHERIWLTLNNSCSEYRPRYPYPSLKSLPTLGYHQRQLMRQLTSGTSPPLPLTQTLARLKTSAPSILLQAPKTRNGFTWSPSPWKLTALTLFRSCLKLWMPSV